MSFRMPRTSSNTTSTRCVPATVPSPIVSMENEYKKLKDRNADLDMQLLNDGQELQKLSTQNTKMDRVIPALNITPTRNLSR